MVPKLAKGINSKKEEKLSLQKQISDYEEQLQYSKSRLKVKENDREEMIKKMEMGNLVKDQLKKHKNDLENMVKNYSNLYILF